MLRASLVTVVGLAMLAASLLSSGLATADNTYTVQDGDTLLGIGVKSGVPTSQLLDWVASVVTLNGLGNADNLKTGQVLKLPSSASASPASMPGTTSTDVAVKTTVSLTYTVADGDTLLGIAAKNGIAAGQQLDWVAKVVALNSLSNAEQLTVGQILRLPVEATSQVKADSATPTPTPSPVPALTSSSTSSGAAVKGYASSYHDSFTNKPMGCMGAGLYKPTDTTIVAVGPSMYSQFPCGTSIEVCGPKGCLTGLRKDSCPGCQGYHVDLSRAGLTAVCGPNACDIRLRRLP
jgi:LysM repeat protein